MTDELPEKHLLAGLDERERGFTRAVDVERREGNFRATFRYEALAVASADSEGTAAALAGLVRSLQGRGYRQLRTRLIFLGGAYLGGQEPWIEYADPEQSEGWLAGLARRMRRVLRRRS